MVTEPVVHALIDLTYAAACDSSRWSELVASISDALGAAGADLAELSMEDHSVRVLAQAGIVDESFVAEYEHQVHRDPFVLAAKRIALRPGLVCVGETLVSTSALERTAFYQDFGRRFDYHGGMVGVISGNGKGAVSINVCRRSGQCFSDGDVRLIQTLLPHLARAFAVQERLSEADERVGVFHDALDRLTAGALLVDRSGRVLFVNAAAQSIAAERDGLSIDREGTLRAARAHDTTLLTNLIREAVQTAAGEGLGSGGVIALGRPSGRRPLQVTVTPSHTRSDRFHRAGASVLVFLHDPERHIDTDAALLRRMYGLSCGEVAVARLLMGDRTAGEIAAELGISTNTVRFHLKQLFAKTNTRRQSELVRLLVLTPGAGRL